MFLILELYIFLLWMPFLQCMADVDSGDDPIITAETSLTPLMPVDLETSINGKLEEGNNQDADIQAAAKELYPTFDGILHGLGTLADSDPELRWMGRKIVATFRGSSAFTRSVFQNVLELLEEHLSYEHLYDHIYDGPYAEYSLEELLEVTCQNIGIVSNGEFTYALAKAFRALLLPQLSLGEKIAAIEMCSAAVRTLGSTFVVDPLATLRTLIGPEERAVNEAHYEIDETCTGADMFQARITGSTPVCLEHLQPWKTFLTTKEKGLYEAYFGDLEMECTDLRGIPYPQKIAGALMRRLKSPTLYA